MSLKRPVDATTAPQDELGAWLLMCEALGIIVKPLGVGLYELTVPHGVCVPEPPPWR